MGSINKKTALEHLCETPIGNDNAEALDDQDVRTPTRADYLRAAILRREIELDGMRLELSLEEGLERNLLRVCN